MSIAYLALGSNVGDRLAYLRSGKNALAPLGDVIAISPVYDTEPVDTTEGGRFLNAVVAIRTSLEPDELLSKCLGIEQTHGRVRTSQNAPRTLDIDLLLYDDLSIETPQLTLPHPRMHKRTFVLVPLADIASEIVHPMLGISVQEMLEQCEGTENLVRRTEYSL